MVGSTEDVMNWTERIERVGAIVKVAWWVLLIVGLVFGVLLLSRACNAESEAKAALLRYQEEARAELAGLEVIHGAEKGALRLELDRARAESSSFAEALQAAQDELKARPVLVVRASTGPVPVGPPKEPGAPPPKDPALPANCLLSDGDSGEITVDQAVLQTDAGTRVLVGSADAYRVNPEPRTRLFGGSFRTEVTEALGEPVPLKTSPGLGVGIAGGYGTSGPLGSALLVSPPFLWQHLEVAGIVSAGPGLFAAQAAIIYLP
jgi:hypothetical protein